MNDWADTVSSHDAPNEEGGSRRDYGLRVKRCRLNKRQSQCGRGVENMNIIHCTDGKPDGWKENKPEKEVVPGDADMVVFAVGSAISP